MEDDAVPKWWVVSEYIQSFMLVVNSYTSLIMS